jgi:hypothetical protein
MKSEGFMVKLSFRYTKGSVLCLLAVFFAACSPLPPTPAVPPLIVTEIPPGYTRPIPTSSIPTLNPDLSCKQDSDCAFAYRTDTCCACGTITTRELVENTRFLRYIREPGGYRYQKWRLPQLVCPGVMCAPCFEPPFSLVCDNGQCREGRTWQEILPECDEDVEKGKWCRISAAAAAFKTGERDQAVTLCREVPGASGYGFPYAEDCLLNLASLIMKVDPRASADFCIKNMDEKLSTCLNEAGEALSHSDVQAGLALCREIVIENTNDRGQQDNCFHNIAMGVAPGDLEYARNICEMMSERVEDCKETAARQP